MDAVRGAQWALGYHQGPDPDYGAGASVARFDIQHHLSFNDNCQSDYLYTFCAGYKLGYDGEWNAYENHISTSVHP
jgi:hypothetical protein